MIHRRRWPTNQLAIERKIFELYLRTLRSSGETVDRAVSQGTHGLDFLMHGSRGAAYVELMEAVVPKSGDLPYQPGNQVHECVEYAEAVFAQIQKKTDKYGLKHTTPIRLLIYTTHGQYDPDRLGVWALRRLLEDRPHAFEEVLFLTPRGDSDPRVDRLYVRGTHLECPDSIETLRGQIWCCFDLAAGTIHPGGKPPPIVDDSILIAASEWCHLSARRGFW